MASVFLSYDRDDAAKARPIALALEKAGHSVWWDLHVRGGAQFSKVIEEALKAADVVVVLWSKDSVESPWVRDEAAAGRDSGRLVPVSLDGTEPPLGFRQFQTIDLSRWTGRGRPAELQSLLEAIASQSAASEPDTPSRAPPRHAIDRPIGAWRSRWKWVAAVGLLLLLAAGGARLWLGRGGLPVVEIAAADPSPRSLTAAKNLFVKLGSLAQVGQGKWQLVDTAGKSGNSDLVFRIADTGNDAKPQSNLVLLDGKNNALLWSREFSFPAGKQADLRQLESLTAGRVLGCALESRAEGGLSADLLRVFLDSCASLADLSGEQYGPITAQLRRVVDRVPRFKPAWSRLITADAIAVEYARYTGAFASLERQLEADAAQARKLFPHLPELAFAELRLRDRRDYGRDIDVLSAAVERSPDNPRLLAALSNAFLNVGRMDDAISNARRAAELDPLSPGGTTSYIMTLAHGGQPEAARNELAKAEKLWAGTGSLRDAQMAFFVRYGDPATAMKLDPQGYNTAFYYSARADPSPANIARLKAGIDEFRPKAVTPAQVGWAVQALAESGLVDDAYYWFGRLPAGDLADISYILFRPALGSVRRDPRFMRLAKQIGLVDYWHKSGQWPDFCQRPGIPYDCKTEAAKLG